MIKKIALCFSTLLLLSCAIEEIPRQPLLATPLGLKVKKTTNPTDGNALGVFFTANNPEIYFTGFAIYVSTREEDFSTFAGSAFFPLKPTDVLGSQAQLLTNYNNIDDTSLSIWVGGAMAIPQRTYYPPVKKDDGTIGNLVIDGTSPDEDPIFIFSSFNILPGRPASPGGTPPPIAGGPFLAGTDYYFAVYAYSAVDTEYSLPSNIVKVTF